MATALSSSSFTILLRNPNPKPNPPRPQFLLLPPRPHPTVTLRARSSSSAHLRLRHGRIHALETPSPHLLRLRHGRRNHHGPVSAMGGVPFFPLASDNPSAYFKPPIVAAVAAMARWLRIFSEALLVRLLLTWFPNVPWDRQPFSALRDLCDPYLSIFRKVLPPLGNVDFSPILALTVLGVISSILQRSPPMQ